MLNHLHRRDTVVGLQAEQQAEVVWRDPRIKEVIAVPVANIFNDVVDSCLNRRFGEQGACVVGLEAQIEMQLICGFEVLKGSVACHPEGRSYRRKEET